MKALGGWCVSFYVQHSSDHYTLFCHDPLPHLGISCISCVNVSATELVNKLIVTGNFDWKFKWINFSEKGLSFIFDIARFWKGVSLSLISFSRLSELNFSSFKPLSCSVSKVRSLRKPVTEASLIQSFILWLCSLHLFRDFSVVEYLNDCYVILSF